MRIISGTLKGRKLIPWKGEPLIRPMTDQIKETMFNVLAPYFFENCLFLDLFSGTGSLALEALSRGARQAHAVEKNPLCTKLIKQNSKMLPDPGKLILHKRNVFSFLRQANKTRLLLSEGESNKTTFDIITVDPPFSLKAGEKIMENLQSNSLVSKETVTVIETGKEEILKNSYQDFFLFCLKAFNDKKLWFYKLH